MVCGGKDSRRVAQDVVAVMVMVQIMLACDGEAQWRVPALVADPTQRRSSVPLSHLTNIALHV